MRPNESRSLSYEIGHELAQRVKIDWRGNVSVKPRGFRFLSEVGFLMGGQENDGNRVHLIVISDQPTCFQGIHSRARSSHKNNVRMLFLGELDGLFAIFGFDEAIAAAF